ncbi:MAG: hypothetical protein PHG79_13270 [Methanosarcina sp.]|nr:hypothetical protein [Methanosarcina sp.]
MPFPEFFFSASPTPLNDPQTTTVGASVAAEREQFTYHSDILKWISETKNKLPRATPLLRKESFLADPMISGTIYPYLKNVLLKDYKIITSDNKLYSEAIEEITDYLEALKIMKVFREDFLDYAFLVGHSYRRADPDKQGNIASLGHLEPSSVTAYNDPWDSSIVAYHQKAQVKTSWSQMSTVMYVDSWFIPFGADIQNIYDTWVKDRGTGNNLKVYDLFETYKTKYSISDINNLRIGSSERILSMHNSDIKYTQTSEDDYREIYNPAPIDSVLLAIWLKRLLLVNSPNLIYVVLSPFLHLVSGILKESKDALGNPIILSSNPRKPSSALQAANPAQYSAELANFEAWVSAMNEASKGLIKSLKEGGVFASGPDLAIKPVESSRTVSFQLIQGLIANLNEEICLGFGLPIALISAKGTELASSRNIVQVFNNIQAGKRTDYESLADELIKIQFTGRTWTATTEEGTVNYSFEDLKAHFILETSDTKNLKEEAETLKLKAETLVQVKALGGSQSDVQALGDEYGFGILGLDNYEAQINPLGPEQVQEVNAILKACLFGAMQESGLISADPTAPSNFDETELVKKLQKAYEEGMGIVFEED